MSLLDSMKNALFGFEIKRDTTKENLPTIAPKIDDEGAIVVGAAAGSSYGQFIDLEGSMKTEAALVNKYRDMALHPEIDNAVDEITNEAIIVEDDKPTVEIILDDVQVSDSIKKIITDEFKYILRLLEFDMKQYEVFRRWYVDGRLYYYVIIDPKNTQEGIQELRYLDPRRVRKVRQTTQKRDSTNPSVVVPRTVSEFYIYSDKSFAAQNRSLIQSNSTVNGLKIAKDSILHCTSGLPDQAGTMVLGYLHKAIKPLNCLRTLEDATVIYALARAPERRIIYVDVGNLPKLKADQLIREVANKHKNKLVYDSSTGAIRDDRRILTLTEDYYLGRRGGGRSTEITTLQGGTQLHSLNENTEYFQEKLYRALNVPYTRMKPEESTFTTGRSTAITRDEIKFSKFIDRLRLKFSTLFTKALEKQLILKNIITPEDWDEISYHIKYRYLRDNWFSELKDSEILGERLARVDSAVQYAGKYYPHEWIRKHILRQTDEDIEEMDKLIVEEANNPQYQNVGPPGFDQGGFDQQGFDQMPTPGFGMNNNEADQDNEDELKQKNS